MAPTWPIIAREGPVDAVMAGLFRVPARAQMLTGPAGVGKSVLAAQLAERFPDRTAVSVVGLAELSGVPLGAFAPALVALGIDPAPGAAVSALMRVVGREPQRYLLIVDDAPRLDDLSAGAVYQLVRGFGVAVVATARLGERMPSALARLMDEGLVDEHLVHGFDIEGVGLLLEARFGQRTRHADVARLTARTEGNPLYLRVLVESAIGEGAVHQEGEFVEIDEGGTPPGLLASIADALAGVPLARRRVLRLVSLTQPADPDRLGFDREQVAEADRLLLAGLLVRERGSRRLRVAHPLVSEALNADPETDPIIAEAIRRLLATGDAAHRFAAIRLQSDGDIPVDADALVWAADYAFGTGDLRTAIVFAQRALETTDEPGLRFRACVVVGSAESTAGSLDAADRAFDDAERHASRPDELALLAARRGEHLAFRKFDAQGAVDGAERAQMVLPPGIAASLDSDLRLWRGLLGQVHERAADLSAAQLHPEVAIRSAMASIMTESMGGRTEAARAAAGVLTEVQARLGVLDPAAAAMIGFDVYFDLLSRGEHERAVELAESRRVTSGDGVGIWTNAVAEHRSYNGRLAHAHRLAALAVDQCRWRDVVGVLALALAVHADTTAKRGDIDGARRILASMDPAQRSEPKAVMMIAECEAWIAQAEGDRDGAASIVADAADRAADLGFRLVASISLGLCIRLGVLDRAAAQLEAICGEVPPEFGLYTALRDLAVALRDRRPERVPEAATRLTAAGMAPTALDGIALAQRMRPGVEVRRRLDAAAMMAAVGVDAPLLQPRRSPLITEREREVALAAAARERSREIAARLGVSVRTIDNQLQSVYRKLGVGSRDELREVLDELGVLAGRL